MQQLEGGPGVTSSGVGCKNPEETAVSEDVGREIGGARPEVWQRIVGQHSICCKNEKRA